MITRVRLRYFKRFEEETFDLGDAVVLAGPNNSGKSTLLQALAAWHLAVSRWTAEHATQRSRARERTGIPLARRDFTAIPLRDMNLLWHDRDTAYKKGEQPTRQAGYPRLAEIAVDGDEAGEPWHVTVTFRYHGREQVYVKLMQTDGVAALTEVPAPARSVQVVHVPPFSGIGAEETRYDRGYQNLLIGQGKPGDILRNLLLDVYRGDLDAWRRLNQDVRETFRHELLDPVYADGDPYIVIEYRDPQADPRKTFDIASAGSGFHQVLTLLGFFYARPASILLLDEPDAHQHIVLQKEVYDRVRRVARERKCQLLISTHSEVLLEATDPANITSFYGSPRRLRVETERDRVREALKRLSAMDILSAEGGGNVLYVEDESDLSILRALAAVLGHPFEAFLRDPFSVPMRGRRPADAKAHFFALQAIREDVRGVCLLDGDNRDQDDHEVSAEGLVVLRWLRYEIENYLVHPVALLRFVADRVEPELLGYHLRRAAEDLLRDQLPPAVLSNPLADGVTVVAVPASKELLPAFLRAAGMADLHKKDYYQIAAQMLPGEIHPEVTAKLDTMQGVLARGGPEPWE